MSKPTFTKLDPPEKSRTYHFPGGDFDRFQNVIAIAVSESGTHRLETADGRKHIVNTGWLSIELEVEEWTF